MKHFSGLERPWIFVPLNDRHLLHHTPKKKGYQIRHICFYLHDSIFNQHSKHVDYLQLGTNIHNARETLQISQKQVAKDLSTRKKLLEQSTVSRIEGGKYKGHFVMQYIHYLVQKAKAAKNKDITYDAIFDGSIPLPKPLK